MSAHHPGPTGPPPRPPPPGPPEPGPLHVVEDSQDHPEGHVGDPQDDGHLHLERVEEAQVVRGQAPDLGWQEGQGSRRGLSARLSPSGPQHSLSPAFPRGAAEGTGQEQTTRVPPLLLPAGAPGHTLPCASASSGVRGKLGDPRVVVRRRKQSSRSELRTVPGSEAMRRRHADTLWEVAALGAQQGGPSSAWGPLPPPPNQAAAHLPVAPAASSQDSQGRYQRGRVPGRRR